MSGTVPERTIYLSAINYCHGVARPISEIDEPMPVDLTLPVHGLRDYRFSALETWRLAVEVAEKTMAMAPGAIDLVIYVSENDRAAAESLPRILRRIAQPTAEFFAVSGHGCANLVPALQLARCVLNGGRRRILLIVADRAEDFGRVMPSGLSVFSDGAAACVLSAEPPEIDEPAFAVHGLTMRVDANTDASDPRLLLTATYELGTAAIEDMLRSSEKSRESFDKVLFANYRLSSQRFLANVIGFPEDQLLLGDLAELAHCFSADLLVSLDRSARSGVIGSAEHLLGTTSGPYSWSMMHVASL